MERRRCPNASSWTATGIVRRWRHRRPIASLCARACIDERKRSPDARGALLRGSEAQSRQNACDTRLNPVPSDRSGRAGTPVIDRAVADDLKTEGHAPLGRWVPVQRSLIARASVPARGREDAIRRVPLDGWGGRGGTCCHVLVPLLPGPVDAAQTRGPGRCGGGARVAGSALGRRALPRTRAPCRGQLRGARASNEDTPAWSVRGPPEDRARVATPGDVAGSESVLWPCPDRRSPHAV